MMDKGAVESQVDGRVSVSAHTVKVIEIAVNWACQNDLPIILASTRGDTASVLLDMIGGRNARVMIITHDSRRVCNKNKFDFGVRNRIEKLGYLFVEDHATWMPSIAVSRYIEKIFDMSVFNPKHRKWERDYGVGGKVCFLIAQRAMALGFIKKSEPCVCIAGHRAGADTALVIRTGSFRCEHELVKSSSVGP